MAHRKAADDARAIGRPARLLLWPPKTATAPRSSGFCAGADPDQRTALAVASSRLGSGETQLRQIIRVRFSRISSSRSAACCCSQLSLGCGLPFCRATAAMSFFERTLFGVGSIDWASSAGAGPSPSHATGPPGGAPQPVPEMQQFASTSAATRNAMHFEIMVFVSKPGNQGRDGGKPPASALSQIYKTPATLKNRAAQVRPS